MDIYEPGHLQGFYAPSPATKGTSEQFPEGTSLGELANELRTAVRRYGELLDQMLPTVPVNPGPTDVPEAGIRAALGDVEQALHVNNMRLNELAIRIGGLV